MTEAAHTPGPWEFRTGETYADFVVHAGRCAVAPLVTGDTMEEALANACLISAAPELFAAAIAASHALKSYAYGDESTGLAERIAQSLDAALAKARGAA